MKTTGNAVLVTGGTSGIGLELAVRLAALGNSVVVTGRDPAMLDAVRRDHPAIRAIESDASDSAAIAGLYRAVVEEFPDLNVVINNAGIMRKMDLTAATADPSSVRSEIGINFTGTVEMTLTFLPQLLRRPHAAIVNVSSGLAYVPLPIAPVYCATKAAIHSFTQSLRAQLKGTNVEVFELAPPITRTHLFAGSLSLDEIGVPPMDAAAVATRAIAGIARDRFEIRPGLSSLLRLVSRVAPSATLKPPAFVRAAFDRRRPPVPEKP